MVDCQRWLNNEIVLRREHLILSGSKTDLSGIFLDYKSIHIFLIKPHLLSLGSREAAGPGISRRAGLSAEVNGEGGMRSVE
jgi:hypothetical protein